MSIIGTIIVGLIAGLVARLVMPGRQKMGLVLTTLLGIGGAFVASFLGQLLGLYRADEPAGFLGAVIGALLLLFLFGMARAERRT